jgi:hypothetical protein
MTTNGSRNRQTKSQAKGTMDETAMIPSFVRIDLGSDGEENLERVIGLLKLAQANDTPGSITNQVLFVDFRAAQYEPGKPVYAAPKVKRFLESVVKTVRGHAVFVGYAMPFASITEESVAAITLRPLPSMLKDGKWANAFNGLCRAALRDVYPNYELLFGTDATQLLGVLQLPGRAKRKRSENMIGRLAPKPRKVPSGW